jgi:hypothetical protein
MRYEALHLYLPRRARRCLGALALLGGILWLAEEVWAPRHAAANLLLISYYVAGLGLASGVFLALLQISGACWFTPLQRVPQALTAVFPAGALGVLGVLFTQPSLYPWNQAERLATATPFQEIWLNRPFFLCRATAYILCWYAGLCLLVRAMACPPLASGAAPRQPAACCAAAFLVVFALTFWLASTDWIMSLEANWASTLFSFYQFAGLFLSGLAALICLVIWLQYLGPLRWFLTSDQLHDLGKLLFGFATVWAYLWSCQYLLIWYVHLPEETTYYVRRLQGAWHPLFYVNLVLNWGVPFFALLSQAAKRRPQVLLPVSLAVLAGHWLDLYLMILPTLEKEVSFFFLWDMGLPLGALGLCSLIVFQVLGQGPLVLAPNFSVCSFLTTAESQSGTINRLVSK